MVEYNNQQRCTVPDCPYVAQHEIEFRVGEWHGFCGRHKDQAIALQRAHGYERVGGGVVIQPLRIRPISRD